MTLIVFDLRLVRHVLSNYLTQIGFFFLHKRKKNILKQEVTFEYQSKGLGIEERNLIINRLFNKCAKMF